MPPGLCALYIIFWSILNRKGCGGALLVAVSLAALYPVFVPTGSIYLAARELFWGKDGEGLMKRLKMFEHLGQYFLFNIL